MSSDDKERPAHVEESDDDDRALTVHDSAHDPLLLWSSRFLGGTLAICRVRAKKHRVDVLLGDSAQRRLSALSEVVCIEHDLTGLDGLLRSGEKKLRRGALAALRSHVDSVPTR